MAAGGSEARETLNSERQIASQLVTEKQRLQMQIDSLTRQLDNERTARSRLSVKDFAHQDTRPYDLGTLQGTQPEMQAPALPPAWDDATDAGQTVQTARPVVKTEPMGAVTTPAKKGK